MLKLAMWPAFSLRGAERTRHATVWVWPLVSRGMIWYRLRSGRGNCRTRAAFCSATWRAEAVAGRVGMLAAGGDSLWGEAEADWLGDAWFRHDRARKTASPPNGTARASAANKR